MTARPGLLLLITGVLLQALAATSAVLAVARGSCAIGTPTGGLINLQPIFSQTQHSSINASYRGVHFTFSPCLAFHSTSHHVSSQPVLDATVRTLQTKHQERRIVLATPETALPPKYNTHHICHRRRSSLPRNDCIVTRLIHTKETPKEAPGVTTPRVPTTGNHLEHEHVESEEHSERSDDAIASGEGDDVLVVRAKEQEEPHSAISFPDNITAVLRFRSTGRCRGLRSFVLLQCDRSLQKAEEVLFQVWSSGMCPGHLYLMLSHKCCCVGACPISDPGTTTVSSKSRTLAGEHTRQELYGGNDLRLDSHREVIQVTDHTYIATAGPQTAGDSMSSQQIDGVTGTGRAVDLLEWLQERGFSGKNISDFQNYINGMLDSGIEDDVQMGDEAADDEESPRFVWLIVVVNMGVIGAAICIAGLCCRKGGSMAANHGPYGYLPALQSSRLTLASSVESFFPQNPAPPAKSAEYLDYSSPLAKSSKLPQLANCVIPSGDLDIGQRLGGGLFGDTYLAEWKDRPVAAKRLTVGVHQGQLDDADRKWITAEVDKISRQRHRSLVAVFGLCMDSRQPYLVSEYLECQSLRDHLTKRNDATFNWSKKIKIMLQVADGLTFLHSARPPILHRDLRCANILIDRTDKVKVVDHGITKITQRLRQGCSGRKGCYCQKEFCALPASIRWTAPELLCNPQADEQDHNLITPQCDVYSYGMVLWETASHCEPFEDIPDENEVRELVISNMRPGVDILVGLIPHVKDLMVTCWDSDREARPTFKQIVVHLKTCLQILTKMSQKPRTRNNSSTTYLKSTLNM